KRLASESPAPIEVVQVPLFAGVRSDEVQEVLGGLRGLGIDAQMILMLGGGNPMRPEDESSFVAAALELVAQARDLGMTQLSSTSLEVWMDPDAQRLEGPAYREAVTQLAKVHERIFCEAELESSPVQNWHLEFLRDGEFRTFTNLQRGWDVVHAINERVGTPFFKVLVDTAHCGDSDLSLEENQSLLAKIGAAQELGVFHASAKTTRGCLSTDDGWIGALLRAAAETGELQFVLVEAFAHDDEALAGLRQLDPRHGVDTTDGRNYDQVVMDGLVDVQRRLNNLAQRGCLARR
ncbi:MAG: hypothetical protein AAGF97_04625, partial [Planctomycetota bacterium]